MVNRALKGRLVTRHRRAPERNVPGTLGCIGLNGGANRANEFLTTYTNYYNQHGSMRLIVN